MTIKLIAIDLDGTLLDSAPGIIVSANATLQQVGHTVLPTSQVRGYIGRGVRRLLHRVLTQTNEQDAPDPLFKPALSFFLSHYAQHYAVDCQVYPGVVETLQHWQQQGIALICLTNKDRQFADLMLAEFKLMQFFKTLIAGDDVTHKKPHPEGLQAAMSTVQATPAQTVMIGDTVNDTEAAQRAGCHAIAVRYGYQSDQRQFGQARCVDFFADAAKLISSF